MLKFLKRPPGAAGEGQPSSKAAKAEGDDDADGSVRHHHQQEAEAKDPAIIITWNCNGLTCRAQDRSQWQELEDMLKEHRPDAVCLQEVRMAAHCESGAKPGDGRPRDRSRPNTSTAAYKKDAELVGRLMAQGKELRGYKVYYSLSDKKYSGSALFVRQGIKPRSLRYSLRDGAAAKEHHTDGRVIFAEFGAFDLLATYSPNNGSKEEDFQRRRTWDVEVTEFAERRRRLGRPLVYVGDLNVAPEDSDLSHPEFFRSMKFAPKPGMKPSGPVPGPKDQGQPGCTDREREGFAELLERGGLVDAFRAKAGPLEHGDEATEGPNFTWRGSPGRDIPERGKYYRKGMRIDHALVPREMHSSAAVVRAEALGRGATMAGFMGSDHCPVLLELRPHQQEGGAADAAPDGT